MIFLNKSFETFKHQIICYMLTCTDVRKGEADCLITQKDLQILNELALL